jgi:hypothetical protein
MIRDVRTYAAGQSDWDDAQKADFNTRVTEAFKTSDAKSIERTKPELFPLAIAAAPLVAGFVIDAVKSSIEKEALKYERQFSGSVYDGAFWNPTDDPKAFKPRYQGFEVIRNTKAGKSKNGTSNTPAFRFVCAIVPSDPDNRLFLLKPLCLETNRAKAKVVGPTLSTKVTFGFDGTWIDSSQAVQSGRIAEATWELSGQDFDGKPEFFLGRDHQNDVVAGWFYGVPPSYLRDGSLLGGGGAFKLSVLVNERDDTNAKQYLERVASFVGDNKEKAVGFVKDTVTPKAPATQPKDTEGGNPESGKAKDAAE